MSSFTAPLDVRSLPDGRIALLRPLKWYSVHEPERTVTVPLGFTCDGASIPRLFWPLIGHPLSSTVIRSGALHDHLYWRHSFDRRPITRRRADLEFRYALAVDGTGVVRRWLMWAAVRAFGYWAWHSIKNTPRVDPNIAAEVWRIRHALADHE